MRDQILDACRTAEVAPNSTLRVLELLQAPELDVGAVTGEIERDPILAAQVIRVSNSALFRPATPILGVREAVNRLGSRNLMDAVLASLGATLPRDLEGYQLADGALWDHSLSVSLATRTLAEVLNSPEHDAAATAGLLADLGKLVLDPFTAEHGEEILEYARQKDVPYDQAERDILGIDHAEVGGILLEGWGLPESIVSVVRWHHRPALCPPRYQALVDLLHVAECICSMGGFGLGADGIQYRPDEDSTKRLGYTNVMAERVLCQVLTGTEDLTELNKEWTSGDS